MRYHVLPINLAKINLSLKIKTPFWQEGEASLSHAAVGNINWSDLSGGQFGTK